MLCVISVLNKILYHARDSHFEKAVTPTCAVDLFTIDLLALCKSYACLGFPPCSLCGASQFYQAC